MTAFGAARTGKELFYNNKYFQPTNDALRQAYIQGGSEWNFGPQIGHASDSVTPVYAAQLPTERGDILRVYAMERTTSAVWQVDMLLGNSSVCWVHIKLTNAQPRDSPVSRSSRIEHELTSPHFYVTRERIQPVEASPTGER